MILTKVNESYPNIEKNELIEILNNEKGDSEDLLKEYGINLNKDSLILENDKYFSGFLVLNISVVKYKCCVNFIFNINFYIYKIQ